MRDHYLKVLLHKGRKPRDFEKQILKENQKKLQIVVKEKSTNHSVGEFGVYCFIYKLQNSHFFLKIGLA